MSQPVPEDPTQNSTLNGTIRVGMIGCGMLGVVHARRLSGLPDVVVAAASDPDEAAMQRVIDALPDEQKAGALLRTDYRQMLSEAKLDAVCISSPNRWHVEQILASLEHGLHILCEKPLSMEPTEVQAVVDATAASGKMVAIAYQSRYRKSARVLRSALRSGRWGRLTSVQIFTSEDWVTPNVGTWRHDPTRCPGGHFADANGHQLDMLFWATDLRPLTVRAHTELRGTPVPITTWGEAWLAPNDQRTAGSNAGSDNKTDGSNAGSSNAAETPSAASVPIPLSFMFAGDARHWREEIALQTERADFVMRNGQLHWTDGKVQQQPYPEEFCDPKDLTLPETPDEAFIAALRGGEPIVSEPRTVWSVLKITRAALASAEQGGLEVSA